MSFSDCVAINEDILDVSILPMNWDIGSNTKISVLSTSKSHSNLTLFSIPNQILDDEGQHYTPNAILYTTNIDTLVHIHILYMYIDILLVCVTSTRNREYVYGQYTAIR